MDDPKNERLISEPGVVGMTADSGAADPDRGSEEGRMQIWKPR